MAYSSRKRFNSYSGSAGQMGFGLDAKKSLGSFKMVNSSFTSQVGENLKQQHKLKGKDCSSKAYRDQARERRESVEAKTRREDELVKHMSNLPGYLQRLGKEEKIQENAFNIGVLDWSHLEKWKGNQRRDSANDWSNSSIAGVNDQSTKMSNKLSSLPKAVYSEYHSHPSASCSRNSTCSDSISSGAKSGVGDSLQFQEDEINSKSNVVADKRVTRTYKTYSKNDCVGVVEKRKETGLEQRNSPRARPKDDPSVRRSEANNRYETKIKDPNQKAVSSADSFQSKLRIFDIPPNLKESWKSRRGETKKQMDKLQKSCIGHASGPEPVDKRSIVYLWPREVSEDGHSEKQPRVSLDGIPVKPVQCSYSGRFSHVEVHSPANSLEIPHVCPLDSMVEAKVQPHKEESTAVEQQSDAPHNSKILLAHQAEKCSDTTTNLNALGLKTMDEETADLEARKCRHPSPNRRLSFSLSRMARSLSSKESSSVPQSNTAYVSVKSGPVTSNGFGSNNDSKKEKGSVPNRARSSPLRRILDPLLKSKGSTANFPLKSFGFRPLNAIEPIDSDRRDTSTVQAHLEIMIKNGLPLLRFVVDNNSSILVATKMNVTSSVKNDSGCYYTFYSIDEVKKKGGSWINHSSKEKSCGFVYNVVGQMRINSSSSDSNGQNPINEYMIKESVLFAVEVRQVDRESTKLRPTRELAAIVVRIPSEAYCHDQVEDWMENSFTSSTSTHNFHHSSERKGASNITTVILPGGIHGLPNNGILSPLIQRWKSGGSCDCGGWDVGCRLNVLSNEVHQWQISRTSDSHSMSEHFQLFLQGSGQQDKPMFNMTLLKKGLYSIEFSPSISLLQAFFVCVTSISCQQSPDLPEVGNLLDEKHSFEEKIHQESSTRNERNYKSYSCVTGETPSKYAPSPPFSPVGRV